MRPPTTVALVVLAVLGAGLGALGLTPLRDALPLFATSDAPVWVGADAATQGRISPRAVCAMLDKTATAA